MIAPIMTASVLLSVLRSVLSKRISIAVKNGSDFFFTQMLLFGTACAALLVMQPTALRTVSAAALGMAGIYGLFLILSQWMYTLALRSGSTALCTVVYSFGFIIPTLGGVLFGGEAFSLLNGAGLLLAMGAIVLSVSGESGGRMRAAFAVPLALAMLASGGLGVMQKVQQNSAVANEKTAFLVIAFLLAFAASLCAWLSSGRRNRTVNGRETVFPALAGLCYGLANWMNTTLAGRMRGALFFPLQNMLLILACTVCGMLFFGEKPTRRTAAVVLIGLAAVFLLCA